MQRNDAAPRVVEIATGLQFPEGPIALPGGDVLLVEIARGTLTRVSASGLKTVVADLGGGPNGAALGPDGACYVCNNGGFRWGSDKLFSLRPTGQAENYAGGSIQRVDLKTGAFRTLYSSVNGRPLSAPNDIVFDRQGGFWFTDPGTKRSREEDRGAVYYATIDGKFISEGIFPMQHPNGVGLSPDERTLYVSETQTGRVWAFDITGTGQVTKRHDFPNGGSLLAGLPGFELLDSLAVDGSGNVCVASPYRGAIVVISPVGGVLRYVEMPDRLPTNICFGGADLKTAYVTLCQKGTLVRLPWPEGGLPLNFLNTTDVEAVKKVLSRPDFACRRR